MKTETLTPTAPPVPFTYEPRHFSPHAFNLESSIIREILKISNQPGVISFAGGLPAPELFPIDAIRDACDRVLTHFGSQALQYGLTMGYPPLRQFIAERVSRLGGTQLTADNIMVTAGSQQGLDAVGRVFLQRGDYIVCASPTYLGALQAFNYYGVQYATVGVDDEGMKVETMDPLIVKHRPRYIYAVPNFDNPTGTTLSVERRHLLVQKAHQYGIPIIDDDPYGELRYSGHPAPSIKSIGGQAVIQLGTFSKLVSPGLRIGWVAGSRQVMGVFERVKQATDLHTNTFAQYVMYEFAKDGALERHIEMLKKEYHERRDTMLRALSEFFPNTITWTKPEGGLFLWVRLPEGVDANAVLPRAIEEKVAYVPGQPFHPDGSGKSTLRLNFSNATLEDIREGIKRLGRVFSSLT